jgi:hypothetical protein
MEVLSDRDPALVIGETPGHRPVFAPEWSDLAATLGTRLSQIERVPDARRSEPDPLRIGQDGLVPRRRFLLGPIPAHSSIACA